MRLARFLSVAVPCAALCVAASCGGDTAPITTTPTTLTIAAITGSYVLKSINGHALPSPLSGSSLTVLSDTLHIAADGKWDESAIAQATVNAQLVTQAYPDGGQWVIVQNALSMYSNVRFNAAYIYGLISGSELTILDYGLNSYVFTKS